MKKLLLFDLDGTLLLTQGAGVRSMQRAGRSVWGDGFSLEGVMFGGGLDPLIVQEALLKLGQTLQHAEHERFKLAYLQEIERELVQTRTARALPGIVELLGRVRAHAHSMLGLLTGNYAATGIAKLKAAAIDHSCFELCVWGDDAPTRPEMVKLAMLRAGNLGPEHVFVIGDTPRDIDCAKRNGCRCIAVATGNHSREELEAEGADLVLDDLSDASALWQLVHG